MPVYTDPSFFTEPVKRCPNHASETDSTNANISKVSHPKGIFCIILIVRSIRFYTYH